MSIKINRTKEHERDDVILYIINLDTAKERRKFLEQELLKTDIPYQFVSAVNKSTINTLQHKVVNRYKRALIPAEVACFLSHFKVKELFLKSHYNYAIILEDDVTLAHDFDKIVLKAITQHKSLTKKHRWDVLKLPSHRKKKLFKIKEIDNNYSLYGGSVGITTMAAIWHRNGVENFLKNAMKKDNRMIHMPIDCALQKPWQYHLKIYNIVPPIVDERIFDSQIRPAKRLKSSLFPRLCFEINKVFPRFYLYIKTWLFR